MFARIRRSWQAWRERRRQYAIDRAVYKMHGGSKRGPAPGARSQEQARGMPAGSHTGIADGGGGGDGGGDG
jgi:hypothetical protein